MKKDYIVSYHSLSIEEVFEHLKTTKKGLSAEESQVRTQNFGQNSFEITRKFKYAIALWNNIKNPFSIILVIAAILSFGSKHIFDGYIIVFILCVNIYIDLYHQKSAHTNIELLKKSLSTTTAVTRNGELIKVNIQDLVPGDIVHIEEGQIIPADGRVMEVNNLKINESSLTGESNLTTKYTQKIHGTLPISDIHNMVWCGSVVGEGSGIFIVTATGFRTHFGALTQKLNTTKRGSNPFLDRIQKLSKGFGLIGLIVVGIIFTIHFGILGSSTQEIVIFSLAVLVSIIPESLPTVINITLARGAKHLAEEHAVVKELSTIESIGSTTVIITDKTGTITENSMRVEHILTKDNTHISVTGFGWKSVGMFLYKNSRYDPLANKDIDTILNFSIAATRAHIYQENEQDVIIGEPTEAALLVLGQKAGKNKEGVFQKYNLIRKPHFISKHKTLLSILENNGQKILVVIGAPETIWKYSDTSQEHISQLEIYTEQGLRTIGFGYALIKNDDISEYTDTLPQMNYLGSVAMRDPIRDGVKESVQEAKDAGIRTIIATGDHVKTAFHIAREIGIVKYQHEVIEGIEFLALDEKTQKEYLQNIQVFARVTPELKLLITQILQKNKEIVTMIGDGVNDTLALKQADVGIAMGGSGTDAARSASSIVLTNDSFTTVVHAIFRGRHVYKSIKHITNFLLSTNTAEALVLIVATFMGAPLPLIATQILLINLVTDGVGSLPFAFQKPSHEKIPREKPGIFLTTQDYGLISSAAIGMAIGTLIAFGIGQTTSLQYAQSMAFLTLSLTQISRLISFGNYSLQHNIIKQNPWFTKSIIASLGIICLVFSIPTLRDVFGLINLEVRDIAITVLLSTIPFVTVKLYRLFFKV